ncbi:MAG: AI-2E family transporter [Bacteroidota bacterium]
MNKIIEQPFYLKASMILIGLIAFIYILFIAQDILIPLVFSVIIAIVLNPVVKFLVKIKLNRIVAISITSAFAFLIVGFLVLLLLSQTTSFFEALPALFDKFTSIFNLSISKSAGYFDINPHSIQDGLLKIKNELINVSTSVIGNTLVTVGNGLVILFLIPVYVFIILYYQPLLIEFIHRLFKTSSQNQINEVVTQIKSVIQRYLIGLIFEVIIVSIMNSVALLVLGVDYAIMLGVIGGLFNLIPYIGGIVGVAIPMTVALATETNEWSALYVLVVYYFIQLVDNNYIVPKIVASKVKINALFSIIIVLVGNALWGISGMFLSIPMLAILKLIFDHIESMKPWGYVLGDAITIVEKRK